MSATERKANVWLTVFAAAVAGRSNVSFTAEPFPDEDDEDEEHEAPLVLDARDIVDDAIRIANLGTKEYGRQFGFTTTGGAEVLEPEEDPDEEPDDEGRTRRRRRG